MKLGAKHIAAVLVIAGLTAVMTTVAARTELPEPRAGQSVYDRAGVISARDRAIMEQLHTELFARTGVAIVVVTVPALEDETISDFAVRVGQDWGVGRKDEDRGVVIALSAADREIFVATGYGVEGFLPDGKVGGLIDEYALPELRQGRFSRGLMSLSLAIADIAAREYGVSLSTRAPRPPRAPPQPSTGDSTVDSIVKTILGVLAFLVFLYLLIRHPRLLLWWIVALLFSRGNRRGGGGFGGGGGFSGFRGGGFGGGGAGRSF